MSGDAAAGSLGELGYDMDEVARLIGDMAVREERMAAVAQEARILLNRLQPSAGSSSDSQQRE